MPEDNAKSSQNPDNPRNLPVVSRKNAKGRPTAKEKKEMYEALRPYYNRGFSSQKVSELLRKREHNPIKISDRTIRVYFKEWTDKAVEEYNDDFIERDKEIRARTLYAIEENLQYLYDVRDRLSLIIEAEWKEYQQQIQNKNYGATPPALKVDQRLEISRAITNALAFKYQIESNPTVDDKLREQVRKFVEATKQKFIRQNQ
jgi:hypothetical protein